MVKFYKLNDTIYTDNKDYNNNKCNCCKTKKNKYVVIGNKKEIKEFGFVCLILLLIMLSYGIYLSLYVLKLIFYDNFIYNILISLHNSMYSWISYFVSLYKTRWIYNTIYTFLFAYLIKRTYKIKLPSIFPYISSMTKTNFCFLVLLIPVSIGFNVLSIFKLSDILFYFIFMTIFLSKRYNKKLI